MPQPNSSRPEDEGVEVQTPEVLGVLERASIDTQIQTAKAYPRSIQKFKRDALELATLDAETARTMFYRLPRGGKTIEGPSVRMAEVVGSSWGNLRYGGRIVDTQRDFIVAQGMCFDLEKNIATTIEVRRRITDKYGNRYNDDMIQVTGNAAISIALRNAIFKVVPFGMVADVWKTAKEVSLGKGKSMEERRETAMKAMAKIGAKPADVFKVLRIKGMEDLGVDELLTLKGILTAIEDKEATWEDLVREAATQADPKPTNLDEVDSLLGGDKNKEPRKVNPEVDPPPSAPQGSSASAGKSGNETPSHPSASTAAASDDDKKPLTKVDRQKITETALSLGIDGIDMPKVFEAAAKKMGLDDFAAVRHSQVDAFKQALTEVAE